MFEKKMFASAIKIFEPVNICYIVINIYDILSIDLLSDAF